MKIIITCLLLVSWGSSASAMSFTGNWKGSGTFAETANGSSGESICQLVTYSFEQKPDLLDWKSCRYRSDDGLNMKCQDLQMQIQNGNELWYTGQKVGTITDGEIHTNYSYFGWHFVQDAKIDASGTLTIHEHADSPGAVYDKHATLTLESAN